MSHFAPAASAVQNLSHGAFSGLPDYVLRIIFIAVMGCVTVTLPARSRDERWKLIQVCRRWRALILETPDFWREFRFLPCPPEPPSIFWEMTVDSLKRSDEQSIDLNLDYYDQSVNANEVQDPPHSASQLMYGHGEFDIVKWILFAFGSQIRSLKWTVCTEDVIKQFLFIPAGTFPLLESVDITFLNDLRPNFHQTPFTEDEREKFTVFLDLPRLRRARIHITNGISAHSLRLPLGNITMLDLGSTSIYPDIFMDIIYESASLLSEGFFCVKFPDSSPNNLQPVYIRRACGRHIKRLRLIFTEPGDDARMFSLLTLPSLQQLKVDYYYPQAGWKLSTITLMLQESFDTLKVLSLGTHAPGTHTLSARGDIQDHQGLGALLEALPGLMDLYLQFGVVIPASVLQKFADGELLPHLLFLTLGSRHGSSILNAVQKRNDTALTYLSYPRTSTAPISLRHLPVLVLAVPREMKTNIEIERDNLRANTGLALTQVIVWEGDV